VIRWVVLFCLLAGPGWAQGLGLAGGVLAAEETSPGDSVRLPRAPWAAGLAVPEVTGAIRRRAFRIDDPAPTTLQLMAPSLAILDAAGYRQVFACADAACGGFDFRFQLDLLPAPEMFVDLGDYRYVLMENPDEATHTVALVASASTTAGFLHVTEVSSATAIAPVEPPAPAAPVSTSGLAERLVSDGHVVLDGLQFATGSSQLGDGPLEALNALADWLKATPGARIVLVGHTDAVGSLEANAALSQRRAASVLARLRDGLGVDARQLAARGAGALSPLQTNLTEDGRATNRRVEAVLLSLEP
jgi:OOP family OmpA-OmpF porin